MWFAVVLGVVAFASPAHALDEFLRPGSTINVALNPEDLRHYRIDVPSGQVVELRLRQLDALLQLKITDPAGATWPVVQNDAGRSALLRATLVATEGARGGGAWLIEIGAHRNDLAASLEIETGHRKALATQLRERALAQIALAQGESLRRAAGSLEAGRSSDAETQAKAALEAYAKAAFHARTAGDECAVLQALAGRARLEFARGRYADARIAASEALATGCRDEGDSAVAAERAVVERTLGSALGYLGEFEAGTAASERALALYRRTGDLSFQAMVLGNLTANYRVAGETQKALDTAAAALALADSIGDRKRALFVRESIATIRMQRGELALALDAFQRTLSDLRTTPYPLVEGLAWNSLGLLYRQLGDRGRARDAFDHAAAVWRASGDHAGYAETQLNIGDDVLAAGSIDDAQRLLEEALAFAVAHALQREQAHALLSLGHVALARGLLDEAAKRLTNAHEIAQSIGVAALENSALHALGDLASLRKDPAAARRHYDQALVIARRAADLGGEAMALADLARIERDANALASARRSIESALALIEGERARINPPDLRSHYFASRVAYYGLAIDILMRLDAREPTVGHVSAAIEMSERARSRGLQDGLAERRIRIERGLDPRLLADERTAEVRLASAGLALARLGIDVSPERREGQQRLVDAAARDLDDARGRVRAAAPRYAELAHPSPPDLFAIRRHDLDDDVEVYSYWLDEPHSVLWRITRKDVRSTQLPGRGVIEDAAHALRVALATRPMSVSDVPIEELAARDAQRDAAIESAARALGDLVLPSNARTGVPVGTRVVIAHGELERVPFALLERMRDGDAPSLVHLPSLLTLRGLRDGPRREAPRKALAIFSDPVFDRADLRLWSARPADAGSGTVLARLPSTQREAQAILRLADSSISMQASGISANREAVLGTDWSAYSIAHFATHATIDLHTPELSAIALSMVDAQGRAQDGFLRVNDLYNLDMPLDLVVLSACDSAIGESRGAEGMFSLSKAFFHAGTRHVLATLWPVDDRAGERFMLHFYENLLEHAQSPQVALLNAQKALSEDPRWRSPYYWSGFVLQGDWR